MNIKRKPIVAYFHYPTFLAKSETFIYHYISNLKHFQPICLAWKFANLNQFHVPKEDIYSLSFKIHTFRWFYYGFLREYFGKDPAAERISRKIIEERNVRLIHAHFGPSGVYASRAKGSSNIPLITTFYGYDISKLARKIKWVRRYKKLFEEGDLFLVEGPYMKSRLEELECPEGKINVQRIAIPVEEIPFRPRRPKKRDEKVRLIFSGRFLQKKGLIYALMAISAIRGKYKNFEFYIVGDGPQKREIENYIKKHNMENYVKLLGFLNYKEYLREMQEAELFIHPSITASDGDSEGGAPTTILEAQAMGMPIISSYHADIPNIVIPGKSALLSNERDCESLSHSIAYLLETPEVWEQMGRAGRTFVETYHDIKKEAKALEVKYDLVLRRRV
jgi:colanic acid/amylovoran biosynthesis glycosyltransferase